MGIDEPRAWGWWRSETTRASPRWTASIVSRRRSPSRFGTTPSAHLGGPTAALKSRPGSRAAHVADMDRGPEAVDHRRLYD